MTRDGFRVVRGVYPPFSGTLDRYWSPLASIDALLRTDAVKADPERARLLRVARTAYSNARRPR